VGTTEGLLLRYSVMDAGRGAFSATQVDAIRFSKKPIIQINVIEEHNKMISLSGKKAKQLLYLSLLTLICILFPKKMVT
jgi:hypothetical protein